MEIIKVLKENRYRLLKIIGFVLLGIVVLSFIITLLGGTLGNLRYGSNGALSPTLSNDYYQKGYGLTESSDSAYAPASRGEDGGSVGGDAEDYEVTTYNARIQTRNLPSVCAVISDLKTSTYVVFEQAEESDNYCNYLFKVEREMAPEIVAVIDGLNPRTLSEHTRTIKKQVEDFASEREILLAKQQSINETLENALLAYNDITNLATNTGDAETLATIINSRIEIIERLTQERIAISAQLDRLSRSEAEALDGLTYTHFQVAVLERKFIDLETMGDSWQKAIEQFFLTVNKALQDATINVLAFLFALVPFILYFFILVIFAKYGWRLLKYVWKE